MSFLVVMLQLTIERRWSHAILNTVFPGVASDAKQGSEQNAGVEDFLREALARAATVSVLGFRAGFAAIALSPPIVIGKLRTFEKLDRADRERVLERLANAPSYYLRQVVMLAKATGAMLYCSMGSSRRAMLGAHSEVGVIETGTLGVSEKT